MDIYLYTTGSSTVTRGFDAYGFTSDYWFSASAQNPCDVVNFMDENSGIMFNATVLKVGGESGDSSNVLTTTCWMCHKEFTYSPPGTPACPHCGEAQ